MERDSSKDDKDARKEPPSNKPHSAKTAKDPFILAIDSLVR